METDDFLNVACALTVLSFWIHNLEELRAMPLWAQKKLPPNISKFYRKNIFLIAIAILSVSYAALAFAFSVSGRWGALFPFAAGAIFANAVFHIVGRCTSKLRNMPGFWSAAVFVLPSHLYWATLVTRYELITLPDILLCVFIGAIINAPIAYISLRIAGFVVRMRDRTSKR